MFNKLYNQRNSPRFAIGCIFIAVCFVMLHLPFMGIPLGADLTQHLQFASTYHDAIISGDFFPGWAPTDNSGFGSIGIRFYPPVAYYMMAFTQMLVGDWYDTFWTNAFLWMFIGALGMYFWAREWLSPIESAFVAIFYTFAPYHRFQIYHFILFAEFAAAGVLPFCFWLLTRLIRRGRGIDVILFSFSLALLILTHIPTTILGIIGLTIYGLLIMDWKNFWKTSVKLIMAGSLALLASAYHWLRLLSEMNWVKHTAQSFTVNFYDFRQHLFPVKTEVDLFTPPIDFAIILLALSLLPLLIYAIFLLRMKAPDILEKKFILALLLTGLISLFMTTSPSLFIWENLGFIQKVQFPWRWLSVGYVIGSFALVFGISKLYFTLKNSNKFLIFVPSVLFSLVFIYFVVETTHPMIPLNRENFATETKNLKERRGCSCWFPTWSEPSALKDKVKISTEARPLTINQWNSESREFLVEPGNAQKVRIATFYYPHWQAEINDQPVEIEMDSTGSILIPVSSEKSMVKLNFREPLMLQLALASSLLTWLFLLLSLWFFYRKNLNAVKIE